MTFHEWAYNSSQLAWYNIPYIYFGMNEINQNCQCIYMDWPRKIANLTKFLFLIVFAWDSVRISARNSPPILQKRRTKVGILCVATIYLLLGLVNVCNSVKYSFNASTYTHCTVLNLVRINLVVYLYSTFLIYLKMFQMLGMFLNRIFTCYTLFYLMLAIGLLAMVSK